MPGLWHYLLSLALGLGSLWYWRRWFGPCRIAPQALAGSVLLLTILALAVGHIAYFWAWHLPRETAPSFFLDLSSWRSGYASPGLALGAILALLLSAAIWRVPPLLLGDTFAPALFIVSAIWRVGCFINGCCYGVPTNLPWGMRFPALGQPGGLTPPSHPTQLYELAFCLAAFLLLPWLSRRLRTHVGEGLITVICAMLYALGRLAIDSLRAPATMPLALHGLGWTQWVSLVTLAGGALALWWLLRQRAARAVLGQGGPRR